MRCSIIALLVYSFSSLLLSANFYLCNEHFQGSVTCTSPFGQPIVVNNFRIRMVADTLFLKSEEFVADYVTAHQSEMDRAYMPGLMTDSNVVRVFGHQSPSRQFTLLITADFALENKESAKYVKSINCITDRAIAPHDLIKIIVRNIKPKDREVDMDFSALIDKDDGQGFMPIAFNKI